VKLLAEVVQHTGVRRTKLSLVASKLEDMGFVRVLELSDWSKEVRINPTLYGEEAIELLDEVLHMPKKLPELTPLQFDILRSAVNIARETGCRKVVILRSLLLKQWPKKPKNINKALEFWANHEARKKS
jgi:DNA-binding MarR family transcriptional regulator